MAPRIEEHLPAGKLQSLQMIMLALPMGVVVFAGIVVFMAMTGEGGDPDGERAGFLRTLSMVNGGLAVLSIASAAFMFKLGLGGPLAADTDVAKWFEQRVMGAYLMRAAILEGSALFGIVVVLLAVQAGLAAQDPTWFANALTAFPIAMVTLTSFPSAERIQMLFEDRLRPG